MITVLKYIFFIPQAYFLFYSWFMFISVVSALIFRYRHTESKHTRGNNNRFALMLPAYKANKQLLNVIDACLAQKYPGKDFDVFVLAQHCPKDLVDEVRAKGIIVWEKAFDDCAGNPYLHALNYFVSAIEEYAGEMTYDAIVLIDKDNLLHENFLTIIDNRFQEGYAAVQGRRRPLNLDTNAACLDYIAETMNDQMLRAGKAALGFSAEVSGSGMAFNFDLYKKAISSVDFKSPVHDKTFFLELLKRQVHVFYEPQAILYEEKTESFQAISQQRTRWIGGQLYLLKTNFFKLIGLGLQQFRLEPIDYALTLLKIPRALHIFGLGFWIIFALIFPNLSIVSPIGWISYLAGYFLCIILFLIWDNAPREVYRALLSSPLFIFSMIISTFKSVTGKIQGRFIHTSHTKEISLHEIENE